MSDTQNETFNAQQKSSERLEVEDEEQREQRMHTLFMQLDSKSGPPLGGLPMFNMSELKSHVVDPQLMSRVQAFLPELAASNAELARRARESPESVNIENVGKEEPYIQMNLGLGVFEDRSGGSRTGSSAQAGHDSDAEMREGDSSTTSWTTSSSDTSSDTDSGTSDDSDSDGSVDIISSVFGSPLSRPIRPLPRRSGIRPDIVMLGDGGSASSLKRAESSSSSGESQT